MKFFGKKPQRFDIHQQRQRQRVTAVGDTTPSDETEFVAPVGQGVFASRFMELVASSGISFDFLNFYIQDSAYLANIFEIKGCEHFKGLSSRVITTMVQAGAVAVKGDPLEKTISFYACFNQHLSEDNSIETAVVFQPANFNMGIRTDWGKTGITVKKKEYAFGKWRTSGIPLLLQTWHYYKRMLEVKEIIYGNKSLMVQQIFREQVNPDSSQVQEENKLIGKAGIRVINFINQESFFKKNTISSATLNGKPVKKNMSQLDKSATIGLLDKPKDLNKDALELYSFLEEVKDKLIGKRFNKDNKKERNVSSELDNSSYEFEMIEADMKSELEKFVKNWNDLSLVEKCCTAKWSVERREREAKTQQENENQKQKIEGNDKNESKET